MERENQGMLLEEVRKFPMLAELPREDMEELLEVCQVENFKQNDRIIKEGDMGDTMYFLLEGSVNVLKTTLYGEEYVCATLKDEHHCVFGEIALLDKDCRSATVEARTPCRAMSVTAADFREFCMRNPSAGCRLLMFLSTNLCRSLRRENENLMKVYQALLEEIEDR